MPSQGLLGPGGWLPRLPWMASMQEKIRAQFYPPLHCRTHLLWSRSPWQGCCHNIWHHVGQQKTRRVGQGAYGVVMGVLLRDWLSIGQQVISNCIVHHLFSLSLSSLLFIFPSFSVLLICLSDLSICLYLNPWVLLFFFFLSQLSPLSPWGGGGETRQLCGTYLAACQGKPQHIILLFLKLNKPLL